MLAPVLAALSLLATTPDPVRTVTVVARDFAFVAPDTLPAGATNFELKNEGTEFHHLYLVALKDGKTLADLVAFMQTMKPGEHAAMPSWMVDAGGPNAAVPAATANGTVVLVPGNYALLCVIPSPDGKPHVMKGMMKPLVVVPAARAAKAADLPKADVTITLSDYDYAFSRPLVAGRRTIRVVNAAPTQSHEMLVVRLLPGRTVEQFLRFVETGQGEPPAVVVGGTTPLADGAAMTFTADVEPGTHALICFSPDHKDGKPHFVHGMLKTVEVAAAGR